MDKIAVLIPCYNEAQTIAKVVSDFKRELPEATIYVYDNNSKDGTDEIARAAGAVVRYEHQQGKGNVCSQLQEFPESCSSVPYAVSYIHFCSASAGGML